MKMNPVVHFEMPAEDKARVKRFYEAVFGWKMALLGQEMGEYLLATTSPMDENNMHMNKGAINGGFYQKGEYGTVPHIVISVDDLDKSIDMVKSSGGEVLGEPMTIPGIGEFVMFKDTEGNRVGMLQPVPMEGSRMTAHGKESVVIQADINASIERVWKRYTEPEHIVHWNNASDDWHTPRAENDLRVGGRFLSRMEAKDGSAGFDFSGVYDSVKEHEFISYTMSDGRKVSITFSEDTGRTTVTVMFEAENENPVEMQRDGWQAILNNFKKYVGGNG